MPAAPLLARAGRTSPATNDVVLVSPIILYDHPEVAPESAGALFDSTEIDEILTLRVLTLTEAEKAEARATDPRAAEIIDRCEEMSPGGPAAAARRPARPARPGRGRRSAADRARSARVRRGGRRGGRDAETPWFDTGGQPWWDPAVDERVQPDVDAVVIDGVSVSKGSLVRLHPSRRADAQDLFFADQVARVTAVLGDVDGGVHVAVVLVDDPAADLHDWYGRYLYFAPDELEPLPVPTLIQKGAPVMNTLGKITTGAADRAWRSAPWSSPCCRPRTSSATSRSARCEQRPTKEEDMTETARRAPDRGAAERARADGLAGHRFRRAVGRPGRPPRRHGRRRTSDTTVDPQGAAARRARPADRRRRRLSRPPQPTDSTRRSA